MGLIANNERKCKITICNILSHVRSLNKAIEEANIYMYTYSYMSIENVSSSQKIIQCVSKTARVSHAICGQTNNS